MLASVAAPPAGAPGAPHTDFVLFVFNSKLFAEFVETVPGWLNAGFGLAAAALAWWFANEAPEGWLIVG